MDWGNDYLFLSNTSCKVFLTSSNFSALELTFSSSILILASLSLASNWFTFLSLVCYPLNHSNHILWQAFYLLEFKKKWTGYNKRAPDTYFKGRNYITDIWTTDITDFQNHCGVSISWIIRVSIGFFFTTKD